MNCSEVLEQAPLFPDNEDVRRHLNSCSSCARLVAEARAFDERLKASILAEEDDFDTAAVERRVMRQIAEESTLRIVKPAARRRVLWTLAAAGTLAAAAMVSFVVFESPNPEPSPYSMAAAHDHRLEVKDKQLRRWRLDIPSAERVASTGGVPTDVVSAVESAGFTFKEVKLCKLRGAIFVHFVYTDGGGKEFSLFLRHDDANQNSAGKRVFTAESTEGHVAGFHDGAIEALVVTDQPGDAALVIARTAARVI
jgi:hypothetical protein